MNKSSFFGQDLWIQYASEFESVEDVSAKLQSRQIAVKKRLEELYSELRQNEVLGDMYDFDKGVHLLLDNIRLAKERIENEMLTESLHRIILTSVQELNRMYGFNIIDKDGNKAGTMNVTFVNVNEVTADMMEVSVDGKK